MPESGAARDLALENPDAFFLSQSGECFHNVTVTGGKQRSEGPLSMKRELRDVMALLADLEGALRSESAKVLTLGREIKELTSVLGRLEEDLRDAEKQAMSSGHMLRQLDSEMARVGERLDTARKELHRLELERKDQAGLVASRGCGTTHPTAEARRTGTADGERERSADRIAAGTRFGESECIATSGAGCHHGRTAPLGGGHHGKDRVADQRHAWTCGCIAGAT